MMAAGQGYSGFQQEAARQAGGAQLAQTANLLSQYRKQQDQAAMARNQAAVSGLRYERQQRADERNEIINSIGKVAETASSLFETAAGVKSSFGGGGEIV
tara:strand:- start:333 stop:632 length:300 start_codon:yes stop_codon:yes gene_type:complete